MLDINHISPYIRVALDSVIDPPCFITERVLFDYELLYIKEGNANITIEDIRYTGKTGDVFLFKPKQRHSIKIIDNSRFHQPHLHFDLFYSEDSPDVKVSFKPLESMNEYELGLFREDITLNTHMLLPNKLNIRNLVYFEELLFEIIKEHKSMLPYYEINIKALFLKLWTYILRENNVSSNPSMYLHIGELENVKEFLGCNLNRDVTLYELEKEFKISRFHLARLFKKTYKMAPIHYHQMLRIEKAREMVQFSNLSLTEISELMGFGSINAFSRAFRNIDGVPPASYRKR